MNLHHRVSKSQRIPFWFIMSGSKHLWVSNDNLKTLLTVLFHVVIKLQISLEHKMDHPEKRSQNGPIEPPESNGTLQMEPLWSLHMTQFQVLAFTDP